MSPATSPHRWLRRPAFLALFARGFRRSAVLGGRRSRFFRRRRLVCGRVGRGLAALLGSLLQFLVVLGLFHHRFGVCHVAEYLQPSRLLLGGVDGIALVDRQAYQGFELARELPMALPNISQQAAFAIKDLNPVLHGIGYPDMPVTVHRDSLGTREVPRSVAVLAELADE